MLRKSFIIFSGIGRKRESALWKKGVNDWRDLAALRQAERDGRICREIAIAEERYESRDAGYFFDMLPASQLWRMLGDFQDELAYIDLELDGWGRYARPTVLGICRKGTFRCLVRGSDLKQGPLEDALEGSRVIVTYNGRRHDLHYMRSLLPKELWDIRVIDLRYIAQIAGFSGGLKSLERDTGIVRRRYVELAASGQTAQLWKTWSRKGSRGALELLKAYNREDTCNLVPIALKLCSILKERVVADVI